MSVKDYLYLRQRSALCMNFPTWLPGSSLRSRCNACAVGIKKSHHQATESKCLSVWNVLLDEKQTNKQCHVNSQSVDAKEFSQRHSTVFFWVTAGCSLPKRPAKFQLHCLETMKKQTIAGWGFLLMDYNVYNMIIYIIVCVYIYMCVYIVRLQSVICVYIYIRIHYDNIRVHKSITLDFNMLSVICSQHFIWRVFSLLHRAP